MSKNAERRVLRIFMNISFYTPGGGMNTVLIDTACEHVILDRKDLVDVIRLEILIRKIDTSVW